FLAGAPTFRAQDGVNYFCLKLVLPLQKLHSVAEWVEDLKNSGENFSTPEDREKALLNRVRDRGGWPALIRRSHALREDDGSGTVKSFWLVEVKTHTHRLHDVAREVSASLQKSSGVVPLQDQYLFERPVDAPNRLEILKATMKLGALWTDNERHDYDVQSGKRRGRRTHEGAHLLRMQAVAAYLVLDHLISPSPDGEVYSPEDSKKAMRWLKEIGVYWLHLQRARDANAPGFELMLSLGLTDEWQTKLHEMWNEYQNQLVERSRAERPESVGRKTRITWWKEYPRGRSGTWWQDRAPSPFFSISTWKHRVAAASASGTTGAAASAASSTAPAPRPSASAASRPPSRSSSRSPSRTSSRSSSAKGGRRNVRQVDVQEQRGGQGKGDQGRGIKGEEGKGPPYQKENHGAGAAASAAPATAPYPPQPEQDEANYLAGAPDSPQPAERTPTGQSDHSLGPFPFGFQP
ncbi:unnamed protein product, partial [Amoebophrya sp. A120]